MNAWNSTSALSFSQVGSGFLTIIMSRHDPFSVCSRSGERPDDAPRDREGRTFEIQDNVAKVFRCSAGVQREGKHLGNSKTVENERASGLGSEVFGCLG
jgi:hypothetical protein